MILGVASHAVAVNSGSSALYAVLAALGAGPGRSVALPSFAPLPTVLPVLALGASPILVDNEPDSLAIDAGPRRQDPPRDRGGGLGPAVGLPSRSASPGSPHSLTRSASAPSTPASCLMLSPTPR